MAQKYQIESGIAIPKKITNNSNSKWCGLVDSIQIGESIWFATNKEAMCFYAALAARGIKSTRRAMGNGVRVWRIA